MRHLITGCQLAALIALGVGIIPGPSVGPSAEPISAGSIASAPSDTTLAQADAHWAAERFDLATAEYRAYWLSHPHKSDARDRAGVLAARALVELGETDAARDQLKAVAADGIHGVWGCRALLDLDRLAPNLYYSPRTHEDSLRVQHEIGTAEAGLARALRYLRASDGDTAWASTRAESERAFLVRSDDTQELDQRFSDALAHTHNDEADAALRMTYASSLQRIPLPDRVLPTLRTRDRELVRNKIVSALQVVVDSLGQTASAPDAAWTLAEQYGLASEEGWRYFQLLLDRYPTSSRAEQAKSFRAPSLHFSAIPLLTMFPTGDSVQVLFQFSPQGPLGWRGTNNAGPITVHLARLNRRQALAAQTKSAQNTYETKHPYDMGTRFRTFTIDGLNADHPDTMLSLSLPPGFYAAVATRGRAESIYFSFQVAGHRPLIVADRDSIHICVVTSRAAPLAGVEVDLYELVSVEERRPRAVRLIEQGRIRSNTRGEASLPLPVREPNARQFEGSAFRRFLAVSRLEDEFTVTPFSVEDTEPVRVVVWTDRTIYRPGDEVHFAALFLLGSTYEMAPAAGESLKVQARFGTRSGQSTPAETTLITDRFGMGAGTFRVPEDASDGGGSIHASTRRWHGLGNSCGASPNIRTLVRPDFDLTLDAGRQEIIGEETVRVAVSARTAQGIPLAGARITCVVDKVKLYRRYDRQHEPVAQGWYGPPDGKIVIDHGDQLSDERILERTLILDTKGSATLQLPRQKRTATAVAYPRVISGLRVRATLDDGAGRYRTTAVLLPVFPGRAWCDGDVYGSGNSYSGFPVTVRRLGNDNRPAPGPVFYRWVRLTEDLEHDRYLETVVHSDSTMTDGNAIARIEPPAAYSPDQVLDVRADAEAEATRIGWPSNPFEPRPGMLPRIGPWTRRDYWIAPDRLQYAVGDTATLLLSRELRSKPGFLELSGGRLGRQRIRLLPASRDSVVRVAIGSEWIPEAIATWHQVFWEHSMGVTRRGAPLVPPAPRERIVVEPSTRSLTIDVLPERSDYAPGDTIAVEVRVADSAGHPVAAHLTLGAVDETLYGIEPDRLDLLRTLYQLEWLNDDMVLAAGMAAAGPEPTIPPARSAFRATAFWLPDVVTDAHTGRAVVKAKLPDDLARYRITARGVDLAGRIGEARAHFTTERPLSIRSRLPRFVRLGDQFEFDVLIDNHTSQKVACDVDWSSESLHPLSIAKGRVNVSPGQSGSVRFLADAARAGEDRVRLAVRAGALGDSAVISLPILEMTAENELPAASAVHFSLADVLREVREANFDSTWYRSTGGLPEENMALLIALAEGWELLGGKRGRGAVGSGTQQLPFPDPPLPTRRLLQEYRYNLFGEQRRMEKEWHGDVYAAERAAKMISVAAQADKRGWKVERKRERKEIEKWLERAVVNPAMNADYRVVVAASLAELDERRTAGLEAAWSSWRSSSPGARALLATCIEKTRPEDAAMLLASAVGFARWSPDSMLASYPPVEMGRASSRQFSDDKNSAEVLRAVARRDPRDPMARALANALILELAAGGWVGGGGREFEDVVSAIVDYAKALSATAGPVSLEDIAHVKPDILHLERTITKGSSRRGDGGRGAVRGGKDSIRPESTSGSARVSGAPDTVRCAVGDTLLVSLLPTGPWLLYAATLRDPTPSGATHVASPASQPNYFASPTARDNHVQMSAYLRSDQPVLEHHLVADRSGTFYVPPAKLFLEHLPVVQAESGAFVLEIRP